MDQDDLDSRVRAVLQDVLAAQERPLSSTDRARITQEISDDILGYGPIEPYLRDPDVSEVMVNGPDSVFLERRGRLVAGRRAASATRRTCAAPSTRSCRASAAASTSRARWWTPACPTAAASTPSSRRWPSTAPRSPSGSSPRTRSPCDDLIKFGIAQPADRRLPRRLRPGPAQHHRVRQHRRRQDDDAQRAVVRSSPPTSGSSPSRTPPSSSSSRSTSSGSSPARPTSRARARSPSATW